MKNLLRIPEACTGCGACSSACPVGCISMEADAEGFLRPRVNAKACVNCGKCERVCRQLHELAESEIEPCGYAAWSKDEALRSGSSSGGVFPALAREVLRQGGIVFGAAFSEDYKRVCHIGITDEADLWKLQGSKYIQSEIADAYVQAKALLDKGRQVYFSGTPCQIAGLKAYLGYESVQLITQDVICHGVPSPKIWRAYLAEVEQRQKSEIKCINFRDKSAGWAGYRLRISLKNGKELAERRTANAYYRAYLSDICLRPSCYQCVQKGRNFSSDLTIGDYWGLRHVMPELQDENGVSLLILRTEKAQTLCQMAGDVLEMRKTDLAAATEYNPSLRSSTKKHPKREAFFSGLEEGSVIRQINHFCPISMKERIHKILPNNAVQNLKNLVK